MKKLLFGLIIILSIQANAQYKYYKDSTYSQAFNFLTGNTSVNNGQFWDDPDFTIPIGFTFHLFNDSTNILYTSVENGLGAIVNIKPITAGTTYASSIVAHFSDLQDRDTSGVGSFSPISYNTTGTAPNRIFKLEWKNAGFYDAIDAGFYGDSIDLQLWLYETSNNIEIRFGNGNYISGNTFLYLDGPGPWIGLIDSLNLNTTTMRQFYYLKNAAAAPVMDSITDLSGIVTPLGMNGNPIPGAVYRFSPKATPANNVGYNSYYTEVTHDIQYSQENNNLTINIFNQDKFQYNVLDINGRNIWNGTLQQGKKQLNTSPLGAGMYILKLYSDKESTSFKFIR